MSFNESFLSPTIPSQIAKNVWVGDMNVAKDFGFFVRNNIKRVVNCTPDVPFHFSWCSYMRIPVGDSSSKIQNEVMKNAIPTALRFILEPRPSDFDAVLIHCHVGVSRSCTVAAAVLRACCASTIPQSIAMVVTRRPVAFFNGTQLNFRKALYAVFQQ